MEKRFFKIRNILIAVLALNWAVAAAKLLYGFITKSTAMSADGFHSFSDGTSNVIGLIGVWFASQPKDEGHPYGHKKYETFASIAISMMLFLISFNLIKGGIVRLFNPVIPDVTIFSFMVMLCTIAVNTGVFIYENKSAKLLKSDILKADAQHTRSDILISISVIFTLLAVKAGFPILDTIASMAIALFIAHVAFEILKESSDVLCDRAAVDSKEIKSIILKVEGVKGCHKIRTRGRADDVHLELHIFVDPELSIARAHELSHIVQEVIKEKLEGITNISIHVEPERNR